MPTVNDTLRHTPDRHTPDRHTPLAAPPRKMVVFYLATQPYGLDIEDVEEILPLAELSRPPLCPSVLAGFLNIGSEPTPVIRLSRLFDMADTTPELYTPLLLLRTSTGRLAALVDRVSEIVTPSEDSWAPVSSGYSLNDCVTGVVRHGDTLVLLLDAERLLLEKERKCIEGLEASERSRLDLLAGAAT